MNCRQVRALLAIFRELNPREKQDLELHLAQCDECKEASAQYQVIGERIRSMPQIEPSPDAHDKLMHALAAEHVHYLQRTPATARNGFEVDAPRQRTTADVNAEVDQRLIDTFPALTTEILGGHRR